MELLLGYVSRRSNYSSIFSNWTLRLSGNQENPARIVWSQDRRCRYCWSRTSVRHTGRDHSDRCGQHWLGPLGSHGKGTLGGLKCIPLFFRFQDFFSMDVAHYYILLYAESNDNATPCSYLRTKQNRFCTITTTLRALAGKREAKRGISEEIAF